MKIIIEPKPINKENFSKFGDMITTENIKPIEINNGYAKRFDDIAKLDERLQEFADPTKFGVKDEDTIKEKKARAICAG